MKQVDRMVIKKLKNRGFTLIEIIVSIAITGLVSLTFFTLFSFGMKMVILSGHNSIADFETQSILENRISGDTTPNAQLEVTSEAISLYQSGTLVDTVPGKVLRVEYPYNQSTTKTAVTFITD